MSNPVLVEVLRGALVESRHRGAVAVVDADGGDRAGARRRRAAGLSALGGQGDAGAAAGRERRRRPLRPRRRGTGAGLRLAFAASPAMSRRRRAMLARAGLDAAALRMRRALADPSAVGAGAGARGAQPRGAAQQLLGQACRAFSASPARSAPTARDYVAADHPVQREVAPRSKSVTGATLSRGCLRHRRLLDADLGDAARGAGAGVRALRHRRWA